MTRYQFDVVVEEDELEDGSAAFHAFCPTLPGCHTWGRTRHQALSNVRQAIALYVEDLIDSGEPVPQINHDDSATTEPIRTTVTV